VKSQISKLRSADGVGERRAGAETPRSHVCSSRDIGIERGVLVEDYPRTRHIQKRRQNLFRRLSTFGRARGLEQ